MSGNELSRDRKPETGTAGVSGPGIVEAHEPVEDPLPVVGRDAWPVVVDVEHDPSIGLGEAQGHRATRVACRIVGEISQHPTDRSGIGVDPASGDPRRVDVQVGQRSQPFRLVEHEVIEIDRVRLQREGSFVGTGKEQQVVHHQLEPHALRPDGGGEIARPASGRDVPAPPRHADE